jgi:hypothetical protein
VRQWTCNLIPIAISGVLLVSAQGLKAQNQITQPSIGRVEVELVNDTDVDVLFYINPDASNDDDWSEFTLQAHHNGTYWGDGGLFIRINTKDGPRVQYRLEFKKRYAIVWNSSQNPAHWDVLQITGR